MGPNRNKRPCLQQPYLDFKQSQAGHVYHTHCLNTRFVLHRCAVKPTWFTKATLGLVTYKRGNVVEASSWKNSSRFSISAKNAPLLYIEVGYKSTTAYPNLPSPRRENHLATSHPIFSPHDAPASSRSE